MIFTPGVIISVLAVCASAVLDWHTLHATAAVWAFYELQREVA